MRYALLLAISATFLVPLLAGAAPRLTLEAATHRSVYLESARNEIYVEARLALARDATTPAGPAPARNIALVVDRSGSMAGAPMAALREAIADFAQSLSPEDIVAVVAFGSEVETLIEAQPRAELRDLEARLAQLQPAGGAALYDALNQGAGQLRRRATPTRVNQLILVTDGPPTKGPRELGDFARLGEALASEGITVSALGLGEEFDEDLLASLARAGHGHFRYVPQPALLAGTLQTELAVPGELIGSDAVLSFEFLPSASQTKSHGWRPATVTDTRVVYRLPRLFANTSLGVLASTELDGALARVYLPGVVKVRLRWQGLDGETRELSRTLDAHFTTEAWALRDAVEPSVLRTAVRIHVSEGLQKAIDRLDEGDPRRAMRALRATRSEARDFNYDSDDAEVAKTIARFDVFLAEVQARGFNALDRKVLRSGLLGQFDPPHPADDSKP